MSPRALVALSLLAGCSSTPSGVPMMSHLQMVIDDGAQVGQAAQAHETAVASAQKLVELAALEEAYLAKTTPFLDDMQSMCGMMKDQCMDAAGHTAGTQPMADLAGQMKMECANHKAAIASAADLAAAQAEERRHQAALADMQANMKAKTDAWSAMAQGYTCSEHMH